MAKPVTPAAARMRCAIYTRKSTEEGLDKAFNSLDAQREACAAYVVSQRHEGWVLTPDHYDDGGFSGGTMERPGLRRLLAEVEAGRIDVIIVYKVDRLTRSLADFAKIVEILDGAGASFVSITQSFNTTTSMGRLTLNVLLSFAQFEREVISERVRDKIAASKAKGMWMGGTVPLGYDVRERKLLINAAEVEVVRHIMRRYVELGSVSLLIADLHASGIVTKRQAMRDGSIRGGISFARGPLYHLLKNRLYIGETVHHGRAYAGEHEAIVDRALFDAVQTKLASNAVERRSGSWASSPSLLAGLIRDAHDRPMSPCRAVKAGKRYRYYASQAAAGAAAPPSRLRAVDLETLLLQALDCALADAPAIVDLAEAADIPSPHLLVDRCRAIASKLSAADTALRRALLRALDIRVVVHADRIDASFGRRELLVAAGADPAGIEAVRQQIEIATTLEHYGHELRLRFDPAATGSGKPDPGLIEILVKAHAAGDQLRKATGASDVEPEKRPALIRLARLSYLAPDIVSAILDGRHPPKLSARKLLRLGDYPLDWQRQREVLGFA